MKKIEYDKFGSGWANPFGYGSSALTPYLQVVGNPTGDYQQPLHHVRLPLRRHIQVYFSLRSF